MRTRANIENIVPILNAMGNKITINETQEIYRNYDVFIDSDITEPSEYRDLVLLLFNASPNDSITLFLNSGGGDLDTALAIIEGLKNTQASVTGILLGSCHSAASMIALHCNEIMVTDSAYLMIHTANFGSHGNTNNVKAHTEFTINQVHKLLHSTYDGFLTKEEIEQVKRGIEFWFDCDEIKARLVKKAKFIESKTTKATSEERATNDK